MNRQKTLILALVVALACLAGLATALLNPFSGNRKGASSAEGRVGPNLFDIGLRNTEGVEVKLGDYKGDILVVNFWATWCFPCRLEIPDLIEFARRYKDKGVRIIGIAVDESGPETVKKFALDIGINYPILIGDQSVPEAFGGIMGFPSTFLLDRDGTIYSRYTGLAPKTQIEKDIQYLLAEHA